jgi:hypothetical protein
MTRLQLTTQQAAFMETFGYLLFPGLLRDRIERILEEFEAVFAARGGGHDGRAHDAAARSCIVPFIDQSEYLSALLDDPRVDGIFASLLGEDYNYLGSDGNFYVGDTGWHSPPSRASGWSPSTVTRCCAPPAGNGACISSRPWRTRTTWPQRCATHGRP